MQGADDARLAVDGVPRLALEADLAALTEQGFGAPLVIRAFQTPLTEAGTDLLTLTVPDSLSGSVS
jgi:hypothetical protein